MHAASASQLVTCPQVPVCFSSGCQDLVIPPVLLFPGDSCRGAQVGRDWGFLQMVPAGPWCCMSAYQSSSALGGTLQKG